MNPHRMQKTIARTALLLTCIGLPMIAAAAEFRTGEQISIATEERIADDVYAAGGSVSHQGAVSGDLFLAGGNVLVNGSVSQDLAVGGGTVVLLGAVGDDVRVGGGNIVIGGRVGGDLIVGGGQTQVTGPGISGDVLWGGGALQLDAPVQGDLALGGGEVVLNAPVRGNVVFKGDKLTLGPKALISGTLSYTSPNEVVLQEGSRVAGEISYTEVKDIRKDVRRGILAFLTIAFFVKMLAIYVSALVIAYAFRRYALTLVETASERPLLELGRGFLVLVALPAAAVLAFVTVVGIPLGLLGIIGFVAFILVGSLVTPVIVGSYIMRKLRRREAYEISWLSILVGVFAVTILKIIPVVGWIACFALLLISIGAMSSIKWKLMRDWR